MEAPPSAEACARLLLDTIPRLMRALHSAVRHQLGPDGEPATMSQLRLLAVIEPGPCTLGELAARHLVTPSTMSRSIDLLVRKGWVDRQHDPEDRRQVILRLTAAGREAHAEMRARIQAVVVALMATLPPAERARLYAGLEVLYGLLPRPAPAAPLHERDAACAPSNARLAAPVARPLPGEAVR